MTAPGTTPLVSPRGPTATDWPASRSISELARTVAALWRKGKPYLTLSGALSLALGLLLRRQFAAAGVVVVNPGWPLPTVENRGGRIEVGNLGLFSGVRLECWQGSRIRIGTGTYLNRNTEIVAAQSVTIGRDCKFARDVIVMDTDQHVVPGQGLIAAPVEIEDRVWIGARAIILKGVHIGHDSIIGAGAVVTKSVPPHSVVVGQAARVIRTLDPTDRLITSGPISTPAQSQQD